METRGHPPLLVRAGTALLIGLLGATDWRLASLALIGVAVGARVPAAMRGVVAVLAAAACWQRAEQFAASALLLALALSSVRRSAWARHLAPSAVLAILVLAVVHSDREAAAVLVIGTLALAPLEVTAGRAPVMVGLLLAALPGGWTFARAELSSRALTPSSDDAARTEAIALAHDAGLHNLEGRSRLALAQSLAKGGAFDQALETMAAAPRPGEPDVDLMTAELEVHAGHLPGARFRLAHLAQAFPRAHAALDGRTATLWARALLRRGHRREALEALEGADDPEAAPLRTAASSETGPERAGSFAGALRLAATPLPSGCIPRGGRITFDWTWEVQTGFARGEGAYAFIHAFGPQHAVLGADHLIASRPTDTLRPGERLVDVFTLPIPTEATPGSYDLNVGVYEPATDLRFQPLDRPEHQSYEDPGSFEVCP